MRHTAILLLHLAWSVTALVGIPFRCRLAWRLACAASAFFGMLGVFVGLLVILAAWIGLKGDIYKLFSLATVGSVAWSITSWERITYLSYIRAKESGLHTGFSRITRADQLLVLMTPIIIACIIGGIHAMTNSITTSDRLEDFLMVGQLGVACGVFLALPWFCLPLIMSCSPPALPSSQSDRPTRGEANGSLGSDLE